MVLFAHHWWLLATTVVARSLAFGPWTNNRDAVYAATRALVHAPFSNRKALVRIIVCSILGRQAMPYVWACTGKQSGRVFPE
jgi:hypothetical protein